LIRPSKSWPNNACDGMPKISNMQHTKQHLPLRGGGRQAIVLPLAEGGS
jgi:hypothetical protein